MQLHELVGLRQAKKGQVDHFSTVTGGGHIIARPDDALV
jgi:hypothetical protein